MLIKGSDRRRGLLIQTDRKFARLERSVDLITGRSAGHSEGTELAAYAKILCQRTHF
jgi:hypothetical protein